MVLRVFIEFALICIFALVVTPAALILRLFKSDPLGMSLRKSKVKSYWVKRM